MAELTSDAGSICSQCHHELSQAECFREKCLQAEENFRTQKLPLDSKESMVEVEILDECHLAEEPSRSDKQVVITVKMLPVTEPIRRSQRKISRSDLKCQRGSKL